MTTAFAILIMSSLILGSTACQTLKEPQPKSAKDDNATDLSVAVAYLDSGRPDKAMYELRAIIERDPSNSEAHSLMGLAQLALKNPRKAVDHLEKAWKLAPACQNALNLSSAYIENKQYDNAQKIIIKGLELKESPPYRNRDRFYHNLGLLAERKGNLVAAEKSYRKALEENPTFYLSRARLATMLEEKSKIELAKEHWEQARNACPGCFEATRHLSNIYRGKGELKTALGLVQDYRKLEGVNPSEGKLAAELESELMAERSKSAAIISNEKSK